VAFVVRRGADDVAVKAEHRAQLMPLIIRLLTPTLRKRHGRIAGKGTPGAARKATIDFLGGLDTAELTPLFRTLFQPMAPTLRGGGGGEQWATRLGAADPGCYARLDMVALARLPTRARVAFLNAAGDLVAALPEHAHAFLDPLLSLVLATLRLASADVTGATHAWVWVWELGFWAGLVKPPPRTQTQGRS
jgi:U3 small nucleolar RNA-associated protein 20